MYIIKGINILNIQSKDQSMMMIGVHYLSKSKHKKEVGLPIFHC